MLAKKKSLQFLFSSALFFCTFVASRVTTFWQSNEELGNTNGCYLVTQFSSNPTNRFILSELSFLAKVTIRNFILAILSAYMLLFCLFCIAFSFYPRGTAWIVLFASCRFL